ncbi:MAG: sulfite exporter TauE/SafE family protein [Chitinophagaceae bacterium]|nr:sulfite exporter TauE/SafE family protein [Chitinophagaceae bacterium]
MLLTIGLCAFAASLLTFFSGFGLGTLLSAVMMLFFPPELAIALTAVVHFANNILKAFLVARYANRSVLMRFGIPALIASLLGALVLFQLSTLQPIYTYPIASHTCSVTYLKIMLGVLLLFFAAMEIIPRLSKIQFGRDWLIPGGFLSGFFGGLSGHQGALRSAFLLRSGLSKEAYIGTGALISLAIDFSRTSVYASRFRTIDWTQYQTVLLVAISAALTGAVLGKRLLKKVTFHLIQILTAILLTGIGVALLFGII